MRVVLTVLSAVILGLSIGTAAAQTAPADSAIKGALYDIQRAEQQVKSLTPSRKAGIKRVQRGATMAAQRLKSSQNKGHASWKEANERLTKLNRAVDALTAGRMPGAEPAQAKGPSPAASPGGQSGSPADPQVAAARKEIDRIAGEMSKMQTPNRALLKRYSIQLNAAGNRLKAVRDKSHPAWRSAAKAYNAANNQLRALAKAPAGKSTGTAQAGKAPAAAAADPAVGRAMREMNLLERQLAGQRSVTGRGAKRYLTELYRIGKGLAAAKDRSQPSWKTAAARYQTLKNKIVDLNIGILAKRYQKLAQRVGKMTPTQYMLAREVDPVRKELRALYGGAKGLAAPNHPGVKKLVADLERANDSFEGRVKSAIAERQKYGDVPAKLAAIKQRVYQIKVPTLNSSPVTEAQVREFVKAIAAVNEHVKSDGAYLASIEGKVPLTVGQGNTFRYAKSAVAFDKPRKLKRSKQIAITTVDLWIKSEERFLEFIEKTDPKDQNHRANRLLAKGRYDQNLTHLNKVRDAIKVAALFDNEIGRTGAPDRAAQLKRVEAAIDSFKGKFMAALSGNRMPKARSTSSKLRKVVTTVLSAPKYGYKFERFVINSDIKSLSKKVGNISSGTVSSTVTVYTYKWDQFQATTAEKVGDAYYMYANTFKYYYSGDTTTPLNRWILSQRFQSSRILKENIDK